MTNITRCHIDLKQGERHFDLWRLTDKEYRQLRQSSLPIKEDSMFLLRLFLSERHSSERLTLPKAFVTLEHLFGQSSDGFEDWKGSFCFPLLLGVKKSQEKFFYLLRIHDHRGSLSFPLYRVLQNGADGADINAYREPFELEFSREDINQFISYCYGYLTGCSQWVAQLPRRPFLRRIDSHYILYGYRDGELFEEQIESEEDYKQSIEAFEQTYGSLIADSNAREIQSLLQSIISDEEEHFI